jgi:hypothetical protein
MQSQPQAGGRRPSSSDPSGARTSRSTDAITNRAGPSYLSRFKDLRLRSQLRGTTPTTEVISFAVPPSRRSRACRIPHHKLRIDYDRSVVDRRSRCAYLLQHRLSGQHAHRTQRLPHRSKPRILKRSRLYIVKAHHRDILRHAQTRLSQGLDRADRGDVIERKQSREGFASSQKPLGCQIAG